MKRESFNDHWYFDGCEITLPHDAMLRQPRSPSVPAANASGYFPGGRYVYTKTFPGRPGQRTILQFEGVYRNPEVTVNGVRLETPAYGYIPFFLDLTDILQEENTVEVIADNSAQPDSRWYSGAGIYRPVWLWTAEGAWIAPEGIRVTTLSTDPAGIRVDTTVSEGVPFVEILDGASVIASGFGASVELEIPDGKLWSAEAPNLYTCRVTLACNGTTDTAQVTFGIRTVTCSPAGLKVNGRDTLLRGGCIHHDNGILGAAAFAESEERRVRILKQTGYNAIRSSHNPISAAMLEACDRLGMYVMDETWDMWYGKKNRHDYANFFSEYYRSDLQSLVSRDYNHPCVLFYSIGNEVSEPRDARGVALMKELVEILHKLDATRPVTAGMNLMLLWMAAKGKGIYQEDGGRADQKKPAGENRSGSLFFNMMAGSVGTGMNKMTTGKALDKATTPALDTLDLAGYNYASGRYSLEGKQHPNRVVVGSETFPQDIEKNWDAVKKYPYLVGDFMWTAWDYLGEAGIGGWTYDPKQAGFDKPYPWLLADVGAIDILGNVLAEADYARAVWGLSHAPMIHVRPVNHPGQAVYKATWRGTNARPSWSWQGCAGNKAIIEVYDAEAAKIRLELNGRPAATAAVRMKKAEFRLKYAPGTLTAVALAADGRELGRSSLSSASGRLGIRLMPETGGAKPGQIVYIPVAIAGENGVTESNADEKLTAAVENGELLGFGSANPCTEESYLAGSFTSYYGQALAVIRCGTAGSVTLTVTGETLPAACVSIPVTE